MPSPMVHPRVQKVLAGIAAGALGGIVLLIFLALSSLIHQDPWWRFPNLAGTTFYGADALRSGFSRATLSGAAFEILLAGAAGAIFSSIVGDSLRGLRLALAGMMAGLLWMYASNLLYARVSPLIPLYSETWPMTIGHLLLGACLAWRAWFLPRPPAAPPPEPVPELESTPGQPL
jgi:hypothetical protein